MIKENNGWPAIIHKYHLRKVFYIGLLITLSIQIYLLMFTSVDVPFEEPTPPAAPLPNLMKSDIVTITSPTLLKSGECIYPPKLQKSTSRVELTDWIDSPLRSSWENKLLVSLNGYSHGVFMTWNVTHREQDGCVHAMIYTAATLLGADLDWMDTGLHLTDTFGHELVTVDDIQTRASGIVLVLMKGQLFMWPGVHIGYKHVLETGEELETLSLSPLIFAVRHFFNKAEQDTVIDLGSALLQRSPVVGNSPVRKVSDSRTSHTAFLKDGLFTRDMRRRCATLARLPSASYAGNLQLVRYEPGQYFKRHMDTFHSRVFVPESAKDVYGVEEYNDWLTWITEKMAALKKESLPEKYADTLYPSTLPAFEQHLLQYTYTKLKDRGFFQINAKRKKTDKHFAKILEKLDENKSPMEAVLDYDSTLLPHIIKAWEADLLRTECVYRWPNRTTLEITHYIHWIRWTKERISSLGKKSVILPENKLYPTFKPLFSKKMVALVLEKVDEYKDIFSAEDVAWLTEHAAEADVLWIFFTHQRVGSALAFAKIWEQNVGWPEVYTPPAYLPHIEPQRFNTMFFYLNTIESGGATVFPNAQHHSPEDLYTDKLLGCEKGLAVSAKELEAVLFYSLTPEQEVDRRATHEGCPPVNQVKFGSNQFMWNVKTDEGAKFWR